MRKSWFQFHLSSAVVMSLAAAGILGANFRLYSGSYKVPEGRFEITDVGVEMGIGFYGWPLIMGQREMVKPLRHVVLNQDKSSGETTFVDVEIPEGKPVAFERQWFVGSVLLNLLIGAALAAASGLIAEYFFHGRKGRRE